MLRVVHGNRIELLADQLLAGLSGAQGHPLRSRWVVVPHQEMGQWLARRQALADGVCANVDFLLPAAAIWRLLRTAFQDIPYDNAFAPPALSLRLFRQFSSKSLPGKLKAILAGKDDRGKYRLARRLAEVFDQYLIYRPDWILSWEAGRERHWQAELWRQIVGPDDWHWARCWQRLEQWEAEPLSDVPQALFLFGVQELSPSYLNCLNRFASVVESQLFQWRPSREYWGDAASPRARNVPQRNTGCPLLPSWGLVLRDVIDWMLDLDIPDHGIYDDKVSESLLGQVKNDLLNDSVPADQVEAGRLDVSIQVCASPRREVEVCRDYLLSLFDASPDLKPDQILVLCRDLDTCLPHILGVFGTGSGSREVSGVIPWRVIGDQRGTSSGVLDGVLSLLKQAAQPSLDRSILDLLSFQAIRRKFEIDAGDLSDIQRWFREGGLFHDGQGKFSFDLGLNRLTRAILVGEDGRGWPMMERVHGSELQSLGQLFLFLDEMSRIRHSATIQKNLGDWVEWLYGVLAACVEPNQSEQRELSSLRDAASSLENETTVRDDRSGNVADPVLMDFLAFQEILLSWMSGDPGNLGSPGGVTFASLGSGRLLPARVLYVLGLNEGRFPAPAPPSDLNRMTRSSRRGDRSRRLEHRMLMLEWLGCAADEIVLSYVGIDIRDGTNLATSAVIDEFKHYLNRHYRFSSDHLVRRHPLQSFSAAYGTQSGLRSFSDHFNVDKSHSPAKFQTGLLVVQKPGRVDLDDLVAFAKAPVRWYLRKQLGLWIDIPDDLLEEQPPLRIDPLSRYGAITYALGTDREADLQQKMAEMASIPEGSLGHAVADQLTLEIENLKARRDRFTASDQATAVEIRKQVGNILLSGSVDQVYGDCRVVVHGGNVSARRLVELWVRHIALGSCGDKPVTSVLIGRDATASLAAIDDPERHLAYWLRLFQQGQRVALPMFAETSKKFVTGGGKDGDTEKGLAEAKRAFMPQRASPFSEGEDPYVRLAFPEGPWKETKSVDEFAGLARGVWAPLLEHLSIDRI